MKHKFLYGIPVWLLLQTLHVSAQWVPQTSPTSYDIHDIQFLTSTTGYLCGTEGIFRTTNGGNTWNKIPFTSFDSIYLNGCAFYAVHFFDPITGVAAGWNFWDNSEIIIRTGDAGVSWTITYRGPFGTSLNDMEFNNSLNGIAVGDNGRMFYTTNGGISWSGRNSGTINNLYSIAYKSATEIFIGGDEVISVSTNGTSFAAQQYPDNFIRSISFRNGTGFAAGGEGLIMKYNSGSNNFQPIPTAFNYGLTEIEFVSSDTGFIASESGYIVKTTDGGQLWEKQPANGAFYTIEFKGPNTSFAAGFDGVMFKTSNSGGITYPTAAFSVSPSPYCPEDTVVLTNLNPVNYTFTWQVNNQTFATSRDAQFIMPDSSGSYVINLIAFNGAGYDTAVQHISTAGLLNDIVIDVSVQHDTTCVSAYNTVYVYNSNRFLSYSCYVGSSSRGSKMGNGATISWTANNLAVSSDVYVIVARNSDCETKRDTGFSYIYIATPKTNLPFFVSDTLICENDSVIISLPNSESGVKYVLGGNGNRVLPIFGNGSQIDFNSGKIPADATFTMQATSPFGCVATLPQSNPVDVRELTVDFEPEFFDYTINSPLSFTNASDGDSYIWTFQSDALPPMDTSQTPEVTFTTTGVKIVTLVGNTVEGCTDTMVKNVNLFETADSATGSVCFRDTIHGQEYPTNVFEYHVDRWGNSYVAGFYHYGGACAGDYSGAEIFYLRKYDNRGNLKWEKSLDACNHSIYRNDEYFGSFITGIDTDTSGNVYATGSFASCHFVLDHINFWVTNCSDYNVTTQFFAMKLDTSGIPLWMIRTGRTNASGVVGGTDLVYVDDEHIYISIYGHANGYNSSIIFADSMISQVPSGDHAILQINSRGQFKRLFPYMGDITGLFQYSYGGTWDRKYATISPKMKASPDGKIYLVGAGSPDFGTFSTLNNYGFVAILDTAAGWVNAFSTYQCLQNTSTSYGDRTLNYIPAFTIDQAGAIYIVFKYDVYSVFYPPITAPFPVMNASFPGIPNVNTKEHGSFVAKFDPSGALVWYNEGTFFNPKSVGSPIEKDEIIVCGDNYSFVGMSSQNKLPVAKKSEGVSDIFLMSISLDGDVNWIKCLGDSLNDHAFFMERGTCNNIFYITGIQDVTNMNYGIGQMNLQKFDLNNTCREDSCLPGLSRAIISGTVRSSLGSPIRSVALSATGSGATYTAYSGHDGSYTLSLATDYSYTILPGKNNDLTINNGVSLLDALLIRRHVLGQPLSSPYQVIAADVNGSGTVTNADNLLVKALILQRIASFPGNKLWSFVPHDFVFADPANPFPFDSLRYYSNVSPASNQDYIGIKLGDVNNSWDPNITKNDFYAGEVVLIIDCPALSESGNEMIIPVKAKQFKDVSGMQFTLSWDKEVSSFVGSERGTLNPDFATHKSDEGKLGILWMNAQTDGIDLEENAVLFSLRLKLNDTRANCNLSITSDVIPVEAANGNLELMELSEWKEIETNVPEEHPNGYRLHNYPNPFNASTFISFELPGKEMVSIEIYDLLGAEVMELTETYESGIHTMRLNGDLFSAGIYYLRFKTANFSHSIKMVRLDD